MGKDSVFCMLITLCAADLHDWLMCGLCLEDVLSVIICPHRVSSQLYCPCITGNEAKQEFIHSSIQLSVLPCHLILTRRRWFLRLPKSC